MQEVRILESFRDKDDFTKVYLAGSEVEFTKERAEYLKRLGLVGFDNVEDEPEEVILTIGTVEMIDMGLAWQAIVSEVKKCADLQELERALIFETNGKGRKSVVEALQSRIAEVQDVGDAEDADDNGNENDNAE